MLAAVAAVAAVVAAGETPGPEGDATGCAWCAWYPFKPAPAAGVVPTPATADADEGGGWSVGAAGAEAGAEEGEAEEDRLRDMVEPPRPASRRNDANRARSCADDGVPGDVTAAGPNTLAPALVAPLAPLVLRLGERNAPARWWGWWWRCRGCNPAPAGGGTGGGATGDGAVGVDTDEEGALAVTRRLRDGDVAAAVAAGGGGVGTWTGARRSLRAEEGTVPRSTTGMCWERRLRSAMALTTLASSRTLSAWSLAAYCCSRDFLCSAACMVFNSELRRACSEDWLVENRRNSSSSFRRCSCSERGVRSLRRRCSCCSMSDCEGTEQRGERRRKKKKKKKNITTHRHPCRRRVRPCEELRRRNTQQQGNNGSKDAPANSPTAPAGSFHAS